MSQPQKFKESQMSVLYSEETIKQRVKELAAEISASYTDDKPILCVCVLKGAVMFYTDLMKEMSGRDVFYDFITLSSYSNEVNTSGNVRLVNNITEPCKDRHVLIVEDIVDSGYTLRFLKEYFDSLMALDVKVACLLDKPKARKVPIHADFIAFTLTETPFIIGYGLDYAQYYRNIKEILAVNVEHKE